jgi:hypothetical protein
MRSQLGKLDYRQVVLDYVLPRAKLSRVSRLENAAGKARRAGTTTVQLDHSNIFELLVLSLSSAEMLSENHFFVPAQPER